MIWQILCLLLLIPGMLATAYHVFLAIVAICWPRLTLPTGAEPDGRRLRFAVVIPAYNEENTIVETLESCRSLEYSRENYDVYVIADNCTDQTAQVALSYGAIPLVREDLVRRGKGHALAWGFGQIFPVGHDAFVVLDADCRIDSHALSVFTRYLRSGHLVLQANDVASNPDDSPISYVVSVGNVLENDFFYAPKSRLGLAVLLRGTGMVLSREILTQYPWEAGSIVEDMEYSLRLARAGVHVLFVEEAKVASPFPADRQQLAIQRARWASGNLGFSKSDACKFLWEGVGKANMLLFDVGLTLLVLSRPLVLCAIAIAILGCSVNLLIAPGPAAEFSWSLAIILAALQGFCLILGVVRIGITTSRLKALLQAPVVVGRLALISMAGIFDGNRYPWRKTPRQ